MGMKTRVASSAAAMAATLTLGVALAGPAAADTIDLEIDYTANTSTVIKKLNQKVDFPATPLATTLSLEFPSLESGTLSGQLNLPTTSTDLKLGPLNLATITMSIVDPSEVTGTAGINLETFDVTLKAQQSFKIKIDSIQPLGISTGSANLNLLPPKANCVTSVTTANLSGTANLDAGLDTVLSGTYEIPAFTGCGNLVGPVLNSLVSGPGNTLTVDLKTNTDGAATSMLRQAASS
jgi:hypothetical protein